MPGLSLTNDDGLEMVDGDGVGADDGCVECCENSCATVTKWVACSQNTATQGCANDPVVVWVCSDDTLCSGGGQRIKWRNRCYAPSIPAVVVPIGNLNPGDVLLSNRGGSDPDFNYSCRASCLDPSCTECRTYLRCSPCAGRSGVGTPPLAYILRTIVGSCCGIAGNAANAQGGIFCYTVGPGADGVREDQLPPGAVLFDGPVACGFDCCDTQCANNGGCGGRINGPVFDCTSGQGIPISCCCPRDWLLEVEYFFSQTVRIPTAPGTYSVLEAEGNGAMEFVNSTRQGPPAMIRHHRRNFFPGGVVESFYEVPAPEWRCARDLTNISDVVVDSLAPDFVCPYLLPPGTDITVDYATVVVSCTAAIVRGSWKVWGPAGQGVGEPQRETVLEVRFKVTPRDVCGSNCGGNVSSQAFRRRGSKTPVIVSTDQQVSDGVLPSGAPAAGLFFRG